jgi:hypothetical protein
MTTEDFLTYWITRLDWVVVFGALLIGSALWIFIRMATDRKSTFDFAEMFEGENGRTSMAKFSAFVGTLTATWVVVAMTVLSKITTEMMSLYLLILVAGKVSSEIVSKVKGDAPPTGADRLRDTPLDVQGTVELTSTGKAKPGDPPPVKLNVSTQSRPLGKRREE